MGRRRKSDDGDAAKGSAGRAWREEMLGRWTRAGVLRDYVVRHFGLDLTNENVISDIGLFELVDPCMAVVGEDGVMVRACSEIDRRLREQHGLGRLPTPIDW